MKRSSLVVIGAGLAAVLALGCSAGSSADRSTDDSAGGTPAATQAKKGAKSTIGPGTWSVPDEVKPGTYTTTADGLCYWARLKKFDGELTSINANGNLDDGQRGRITIKATDKGLELTGDCQWTRTE